MIDELLCNEDKSIIDAMCVINNNSKGIVIVVDNGGVLVGVLTDGDIRRAIIGKVELDSCIKKIVSNNCIFGNIREEKSKLVQKISHGVTILPIVDDSNKVVDYFEYRANTYFPVADLNFSGNEFKYLVDAFTSGWISANGTYIRNFENHFSSYVDCKHGIAVSNGTVALHLALTALDIGEGDEVIIPDLTFAATINAVLHTNAVPVIVDVEEESWCINPKKISDAITHKTRAIIPVHLYGQSCNMEAIMELAIKYDLKVIEDCAEAHGASFRGRKVGSFGDVGCFSFFGNKIITTGEGGMCVTNNIDLMEKMRILCNHGMSMNKKYWHDYVGYNYRMTNLQAAIGLAQLEYIDTIHENRRFFVLLTLSLRTQRNQKQNREPQKAR